MLKRLRNMRKNITMEELSNFLYEKNEEIERSNDCFFDCAIVENLQSSREKNIEYCVDHFDANVEHGNFFEVLYYYPTPEKEEIYVELQRGAKASKKEVYKLFQLL